MSKISDGFNFGFDRLNRSNLIGADAKDAATTTEETDITDKTVTLRRVSLEDLKDFVRVYRDSYKDLEEYAYTKTRQIKSYFKWMFSRDKDGFIIAETKNENGKEVLGFIMVDANWFSPFEMKKVGEIHELVVLPEFRKRGIGKRLVSKGFDYIKSKNRKIAELWVGYRNYYAQRFYKKLGFEERNSFGKWIRMTKEVE
jgi:ribosomal protein S18 acetylase RimI-like enzyme